jgi:uncharacterized membrane protein YheB (UPF0754 family)
MRKARLNLWDPPRQGKLGMDIPRESAMPTMKAEPFMDKPTTQSAPPSRRRKRLGKGEWTLVVCFLLILGAIPASYAGLEWLRAFCVYIGTAALIGAFTNRIAIHALFDPWPSRRLRLPYTGIIEIERRRIEQALMTAVSERLVTPEVLAEELRDSDQLGRIRDEAVRALRRAAEEWPPEGVNGAAGERVTEFALAQSRAALERALDNDRLMEALGRRIGAAIERILDSEDSYELIRGRFVKISGRLGVIGHVTGVTDYDEVTYKVIDGIKDEMSSLWSEPGKVRALMRPWLRKTEAILEADPALSREMGEFVSGEAREGLMRVAERLEEWDIRSSRGVEQFIDYAVRRFDVRQVVGRALAKLSTEEVKQLVLKHSREHLGWLEVWGGVLGGVGGTLLWVLSPWL